MKRILSLILALLLTVSLTACGSDTELQDGYYTAQAAAYSFGWKEYITILVKGGSIISVEYNAENASGFIKSPHRRHHRRHLLLWLLPEAGGGGAGAGPEGGLQHRICGYRPLTPVPRTQNALCHR